MGTQLQTPIVYIGFNRPDVTLLSWEAIRAATPARLLLVADGPRPERLGESERCSAVRNIMDRVDWPCEVSRDFSPINLGCKVRVSSGLDWAFSQVDRAIILEDDCLPSPDFFRFMNEMLDRYQNHPQVMMVSGDKLYRHADAVRESYYFSRFGHIWGWATWRRAWKLYDVSMKSWPDYSSAGHLKKIFRRAHLRRAWTQTLDRTYQGLVDTWDHQWTFAMLANQGLSVQPTHNLVSNLGFGADATHTRGQSSLAELATQPLSWPLTHPKSVEPQAWIDQKIQLESYPWLKTQAKSLLRAFGYG